MDSQSFKKQMLRWKIENLRVYGQICLVSLWILLTWSCFLSYSLFYLLSNQFWLICLSIGGFDSILLSKLIIFFPSTRSHMIFSTVHDNCGFFQPLQKCSFNLHPTNWGLIKSQRFIYLFHIYQFLFRTILVNYLLLVSHYCLIYF